MQLHAAASRGDVVGIKSALKAGADINACDASGKTALVFALEQAKEFSRRCGPKISLEAVEALLEAGTDCETTDQLGVTAIHHAAGIANPAFLDLLIKRGANPRHITKSGYSVLLHACYQPACAAKYVIVDRLAESGASLDAVSDWGEFPLGVCLRFGDFETLSYLMELGADSTPLNWSPLHHSVVANNEADITRLAVSPTDINRPNLRYELSPWLLAVMRGHLDCVKVLAERGADLTQTGRCGETSLHLAAEFGREAVMSWLLDLGVDPNGETQFGETPLHRAVEWNQIACAAELLKRGADACRENHVQSRPIHSAHSVEVVRLLVELSGADVNSIDGCGEWPLKSAAERNDVELISWLLAHGAEIDHTSTGETALHAAVRSDARDAVDFLLEDGANPNAQDADGWTPLFGARSCETIHALCRAGADPRITDDTGSSPDKWLTDPLLLCALTEET